MTHGAPKLNRRPRVLQCVSHLALGGAERVALSLAELLKPDFDPSVHAVRGVADGTVGRSLEQQLVASQIPLTSGHRVPMRFGGLITAALELTRTVRRTKPDLIHLHAEISEASYAMMVTVFPRLRAIPMVRTIHNSLIWHFAPRLGRFCDRRMSHGYIAGVSNDAVSAFNALRSESGAGAPPAPPSIIHNGVPFRPITREVAPANIIRVVYGGRLEAEKGTDLIPAILAHVRLPAGFNGRLTIFGSGRQETLLKTLERTPPRNWSVEVLPAVADFQAQLGSFDILLMPSRTEGLALVAIEGLLSGIQIVATNAPGLRQTLPPQHPWFGRPGDASSIAAALEAACATREKWPVIAMLGQSFAREHFDPKLMATRYRALYELAMAARQ
jgi:glycosyltransferase involved in cell wall biosynthesis